MLSELIPAETKVKVDGKTHGHKDSVHDDDDDDDGGGGCVSSE